MARILDEEEDFRLFWRDLGRIFGIQEKLQPEEYTQVILNSTAEFLRLQEPVRSQFFNQARVAVAERIQARQEYEIAKKALPPKDKSNPTPYDSARKSAETSYRTQ